MEFADFDTEVFLRDYWQQRPLVIRNPWRAWANPLDPDELAGLACEAAVSSRLVTRTRKTWKVEDGPIPEKRFSKPGKKPWTLLVQSVDHHVPEVAALLAPFGFVPSWRIDDIMVSYATDGGGVGPHFDQYDVFLIQGLGRRRWQVGARCDAATPQLPHDELRLLAEFAPEEEWLLHPGDTLYLPPRFAHDGVAVGDDCMTYSIGFRAPSRRELLAHWSDDLLAGLSDDDRYEDVDLPVGRPGEISEAAISRLHAMVTDKLRDRDAFADWFGRYTSTRKNPDLDLSPGAAIGDETLPGRFADGGALVRNPASRFAFVHGPADTATLFVDGERFECDAETAAMICGQSRIMTPTGSATPLLARLLEQGSLVFAAD